MNCSESAEEKLIKFNAMV